MDGDLKRILYVEDEEDIRTIAVTVLETVGGFTLIPCASGAQAVAAAPTAHADLILLDVMMPGLDGPTTLKSLRNVAQTAETPVIFMTAKVQANEVAYFKSLGALDVIPKPFDPMTLSEQIGAIWRRRPKPGESEPAQPDSRKSPATDDALHALNMRYAADLPAKIAEIAGLWRKIVEGNDPAAVKALYRELHSLAGSGGTFGYSTLGNAAQAMEFALEPFIASETVPEAMRGPLSAMLDRLKRAAEAPDGSK